MREFNIVKSFPFHGDVSNRCASVLKMFGLDIKEVNERRDIHAASFNLTAGDICYITGFSGSGKSVLLRELYRQFSAEEKINLNDISTDSDKNILDCFNCSTIEAMRFLAKAGISDAFSLLEKPAALSEGQKYRFKLAKALASEKRVIFADEFCSSLDRLTAAVTAFKTARFARKEGLTLILASSHDDLLADLKPDVIIIKQPHGETEVIYKDINRKNAV